MSFISHLLSEDDCSVSNVELNVSFRKLSQSLYGDVCAALVQQAAYLIRQLELKEDDAIDFAIIDELVDECEHSSPPS